MKRVKYDEKGMAFVVLLIIIFFLSMISLSYLFTSRTELDKSHKQEQFTTSLATAEGGLERAIWYLVNDAKLPNWSAPTCANPKVTIEEDLGGTNTGKYYKAEIELISAPGGEDSGLPPRENPGWYIHPEASNIPKPKGNSAAVTINGIVYVFGGYGKATESQDHGGYMGYKDDINYWGYRASKESGNVLLAYDPKTDTWKDLGENPYGNKSKFAGVNFDNKMYMFGPDPNVIVYDPTKIGSAAWSNVANMQTIGINNVNCHSAVVLGQKIYIIGGAYNNWNRYGLVIEFDPANNTFKELNPLPDGRYYGAAGVIKDKIYYVGGTPKTGMSMGQDPVTGEKVTTQSGNHSRTVWKYDPTDNNGMGSSTPAAHMPWLTDNPNTYGPEHLGPWGSGDKIDGFTESLSVKTHVRDPEYSPYWGSEGYGVDHGLAFSNRPGLADHQVVVVDDKIYVIGGNNGLIRTYFDGPGYKDAKGKWHGTYVADNSNPDKSIKSNTTGETTTQRDLYYDYKDGSPYGNYASYRDWQGQLGSYYRWNKELYIFDGTSWTKADDAPTMDLMTTGGMKGVGITNHVLAAVDGRFYMLGGVAHHFRDPNRTYLNAYVVEGDDTRHGCAAKSYVNAMYTSVSEYYIRPPSSQSLDVGRYKIISTGREKLFLRTVHRRIEAVVEIIPMIGANGFDGAIICNSDITGVGNAKTDSYNSVKGIYTIGINDGNEGNIFSNGNISLTGNTLIDGDAYCSPEENIGIIGNAEVTGGKGSLGERISLPAVTTVPQEAVNKGLIDTPQILTAGTYTCSGIKLSGNDQLTINGNVRLYCTGDIQITGNGGINGVPTNFHIYCSGNVDISLAGNDRFFGTIYAPESEIKITGDGNVYGQFVCNTIQLNGNGKIVYDEQLKNTQWWPVERKNARIVYWREVIL